MFAIMFLITYAVLLFTAALAAVTYFLTDFFFDKMSETTQRLMRDMTEAMNDEDLDDFIPTVND